MAAHARRASRAALGATPDNTWLDLAHLVPAFFPEHAARTLDDWVRVFGIENYARHDALADALATAQLLQVVLARAEKSGETRTRELASHARARTWLGRQRR
jgi:DNA polymerase-3 subunit epsilon